MNKTTVIRPIISDSNPWRLSIAALTALLLVFGCSQEYSLDSAYAAKPQMTDAEISSAVAHAMMQDPGVSSYWIDVVTSDGIVTLTGSTDTILSKERATKVAQTVRGVRSVVNTIDVEPVPRADSEIQEDVEEALLTDAATDSWEISPSVDNGVVTLTGTVESWQEKQLASKVAKGVMGVREVENEINVDYETDRTDHEIEAEVERTLDWDALVDDALITVQVEDGEVTLLGTVGSAAEKSEAIADAWVAGVTSVDADELEVESWARDERFRKDKYVSRPDEKISRAVEDALVYDPRVLSINVDVYTEGGVVTLSGTVDSLRAKRAAATTARNTVGVWRVRNRIMVRPSTPNDEQIEDRIEDALRRDPDVERYEISVAVVDKEAYLYGDVDSYYEKSRAEDAAATVYGVVDVHNNIDVDDEYEMWTYDPYLDDIDAYEYDWYEYPNYTTNKSDWEIKEDIEDELFWSPFVDEDDITVAVDDGVAILAGTVETMSERQSAEKNAYDGGAVAVDNDIMVTNGPDYYQP